MAAQVPSTYKTSIPTDDDIADKSYSYTVLIADFGIARSYENLEAIETTGRTSFTRKYASLEVLLQDCRGQHADIFSLGCVFLELFTFVSDMFDDIDVADCLCLLGSDKGMAPSHQIGNRFKDRLSEALYADEEGNCSYQANIANIAGLLRVEEVHAQDGIRRTIVRMLHKDPNQRPTADELAALFPGRNCCSAGPCPLEVHDDSVDD